MKQVVIDASIAAAWLFDDEKNAEAEAIFLELPQTRLRVPSLFWSEARNFLLLGIRRKRIIEEEALANILRLRRLNIEDCGNGDDLTVMKLAQKHGLTAYDACYLELAANRKCQLLTLDKRLRAAADTELALGQPS